MHRLGCSRVSAWFKGKPWRVTNSGWLGSSWQSQRAPGAGVGPGGVDRPSPTPATRRCYPHLNQARISLSTLIQAVAALALPFVFWNWKLKYPNDSVFDSVVYGVTGISTCIIAYGFSGSATKSWPCFRRGVMGIWCAYFLIVLWFSSVEWYWFFEDCTQCSNYRRIYQYRLFSCVIATDIEDWNEPDTMEAIASDLGFPCSHSEASREVHVRLSGLCVAVQNAGTMRMHRTPWYPPCARDVVRFWAARDPGFASTFRRRVMEEHDLAYWRTLRNELRHACAVDELHPATSRSATAENENVETRRRLDSKLEKNGHEK